MNTEEYERLNHSVWECKYHVFFIPKYRKKAFFGVLRIQLGPILRRLVVQKGCEILEGHVMSDRIHMLISIPRWMYQRQKRYCYSLTISRTRKELYRRKVLGMRILFINSWKE